jgi:hypothetical protein
MPVSIRLEPDHSLTIPDLAHEMVYVAQRLGRPVVLEIDGVRLRASPDTDPAKIVARYTEVHEVLQEAQRLAGRRFDL